MFNVVGHNDPRINRQTSDFFDVEVHGVRSDQPCLSIFAKRGFLAARQYHLIFLESWMLPNYYACTGCGEAFNFSSREARYFFKSDSSPLAGKLSGSDLHSVPVRPGWCKDCAMVCLVEDIAPLRKFEDAYGAVRAGRTVEYPAATECLGAQQAQDELETYLRWRMDRRHSPRALCCGGTSYQFLDVSKPLLKHAECDFGVVEPHYLVSSYNGPGSGVHSPANIRVYSGEGVLIGLLTCRPSGADTWEVVPVEYSRVSEV